MQTLFLTPAASRFDSNPNPSSVPADRSAAPMHRRRKKSLTSWRASLATFLLCVLLLNPIRIRAIDSKMRAAKFPYA